MTTSYPWRNSKKDPNKILKLFKRFLFMLHECFILSIIPVSYLLSFGHHLFHRNYNMFGPSPSFQWHHFTHANILLQVFFFQTSLSCHNRQLYLNMKLVNDNIVTFISLTKHLKQTHYVSLVSVTPCDQKFSVSLPQTTRGRIKWFSHLLQEHVWGRREYIMRQETKMKEWWVWDTSPLLDSLYFSFLSFLSFHETLTVSSKDHYDKKKRRKKE